MNPAPPATTVGPGAPTPPGSHDVLSLYKLEYERAAIRYNDIYSAIWQIFSYMSVVSGGILAFGTEHFDFRLLFFLALLPLVFWYWAVFRPHDEYGESCLERLKSIEGDLNLHHYRAFQELKNSQTHKRCPGNVKAWVRSVFGAFTAIWLLFGVWAGGVRWEGKTKLILEKQTELKIVVPGPEGQGKWLDERNITGPRGQPTAAPRDKARRK